MKLKTNDAAALIGCHPESLRAACRRHKIALPLDERKIERLKRLGFRPGKGAGRGWKPGRRRHTELTPGKVRALLRRVEKQRERRGLSREALAQQLRVSARTLARWREGTDVPSPQRLALVRRWLEES